MKEYMFVFGRNPEISLAEAVAYFGARNIVYNLKVRENLFCIFSLDNLDFEKLIKELGGTVKIAELISYGNVEEIEYELDKNLIYPDKDKINYAISSYKSNLVNFVEGYLKNRFKKESVKATYKKPRQKFSSIMMPEKLIKKDLIREGFELVIYGNYIGKTIAVSDPEEIKKRDLEMPEKDYLKSISIRMAKILINLSGKKEGILLDPFCGVGVILQEALLKGFRVIGVDSDESSIKKSDKNLSFIKNKYRFGNYKLINMNSTKLRLDERVDAVVTEPYLGPYIKKLPEKEEIKKIISDLSDLYKPVLIRCREILKDNGKIVFIVPKFRIFKGGMIGIDFIKIVDEIGLEASSLERIDIPLVYKTKEGKFEREIWILNKKL